MSKGNPRDPRRAVWRSRLTWPETGGRRYPKLEPPPELFDDCTRALEQLESNNPSTEHDDNGHT